MSNETVTAEKQLPEWMDCKDHVEGGTATALEQFIFNFEPAGASDEEFRAGLAAVWMEARAEVESEDCRCAKCTALPPPATHLHCDNCDQSKCSGVGVAALPPREPSPDWVLRARAEGRAEFLAILLNESPEGFGETDEYIGSHAIADTGDYGSHWNEAKLRELFQVDEPTYSYFENVASTFWSAQAECEGLRDRLANETPASPVPDTRTEDELHAARAHPDYEYQTTTCGRKQNYDWPELEAAGWEDNVYGNDPHSCWERFDYHEEHYWRRKRAAVSEGER